MRLLKVFIFLLLGSAFSFPSYGINKCTDEKGKVTFSDAPCPPNSTTKQFQGAAAPNEEDIDAAQARAKKMRQETEQIDAEREKARRSVNATISASDQRCIDIRKNKAKHQRLANTYQHPDNVAEAQRQVAHWNEREFFECDRYSNSGR